MVLNDIWELSQIIKCTIFILQSDYCVLQDKKVISMDGNFKLVRRRAAGSSASSEERHPDRFFFKQHNVDAFVENYTDTASQKKVNRHVTSIVKTSSL